MSTAQPGIFAQGTRSHYFLEYDLRPDADPDVVLAALRALREPPVTAGGANLVMALGPDLWRRLRPDEAPAALQDFAPIEGANGFRAPSTQRDIWLWIHGTTDDVCLDIARAATFALAPAATLALEQPAFVYLDSRDMTGFIDGTENPPVWEAHMAALVPDGEVGQGGAFLMTMKWVHDLGKFHALEEQEQEKVFGRTKPDSVELDDDVKPPTAHIARVVIEDDDGEEMEIYRRSVPFGNVCEQGLYFVAFSSDPEKFRRMLAAMFGVGGDGLHDRLVEFTHPETGSFFFTPSLEALYGLFETD
jgi:putative iron-dependent peroxidase